MILIFILIAGWQKDLMNAKKYERKGNFTKAESLYIEAFRKAPERVYSELKRFYEKREEYEKLKKITLEFLKENPYHKKAIKTLIKVCEKLGDKYSAINYLKKLKNKMVYEEIANLYLERGDTLKALKYYKKAQNNLKIGLILKDKKPEKAIKYLKKEKGDKAKIGLFECYLKLGRFEDAKRAIEGTRDENYFIGLVDFYDGNIESAKLHFSRVLPSSPYAREAMKRIFLISESQSEDDLKTIAFAEFLVFQRKFREAKRALMSVQDSTLRDDAFLLLGEIYEKEKNIKSAISAYTYIITHYNNFSAQLAYLKLCKIFKKQKKKEEIKNLREEFIRKFPASPLLPYIKEITM